MLLKFLLLDLAAFVATLIASANAATSMLHTTAAVLVFAPAFVKALPMPLVVATSAIFDKPLIGVRAPHLTLEVMSTASATTESQTIDQVAPFVRSNMIHDGQETDIGDERLRPIEDTNDASDNGGSPGHSTIIAIVVVLCISIAFFVLIYTWLKYYRPTSDSHPWRINISTPSTISSTATGAPLIPMVTISPVPAAHVASHCGRKQ